MSNRPSVFEESIDQIYASDVAYTLSLLIRKTRNSGFQLKYPEGFPELDAETFVTQSVDLRNAEGEDGLCLHQICKLISLNKTDLQGVMGLDDVGWAMQLAVIEYFENADDDSIWKSDQIFLEVFRSYQENVACVYGVFKDKRNKTITITFRGSQAPSCENITYDWRTNLNAFHTEMKTPKLVQDKMKGALKTRVLVHRGFHRYIFDNSNIEGQQRYAQIQDDIHSLIAEGNPQGYKVYVTGHSLGAGLSTLVAFELAGSNEEWLPKPITCINIASPYVGTSGFRTAFQCLEEDGLLRYLRINNSKDIVPTLSPLTLGSGTLFSWSLLPRLYKHVGINLRLKDNGYEIMHPAGLGFCSSISNALKNSMFKPFWRFGLFHSRPLHIQRLKEHKSDLSKMYIDDMYNNPEIVGTKFVERRKEFNQAYKLDETADVQMN